jgi:hypothetical protein
VITISNNPPLPEARTLIAYDLALRILGLHLYPKITEEQALEVYAKAKELDAKLRTS